MSAKQDKILAEGRILDRKMRIDDSDERYLRDIKELKTDDVDDSIENKDLDVPSEIEGKKEVASSPKSDNEFDLTVKKVSEPKPYSLRDVILAIVNAVALVTLFILLAKTDSRVEEYNKLRAQFQRLSESPETISSQIEATKEKFEKVDGAFLDRTRIVNFVNDIEAIKKEDTTISKVTFTNDVPVRDRTGNVGYPVLIEFIGDWQKISDDLFEIERLPYLFRVVRVESEKDPLSGMITFKYGGILYVKDLGEN
jgi:hypothetical protein